MSDDWGVDAHVHTRTCCSLRPSRWFCTSQPAAAFSFAFCWELQFCLVCLSCNYVDIPKSQPLFSTPSSLPPSCWLRTEIVPNHSEEWKKNKKIWSAVSHPLLPKEVWLCFVSNNRCCHSEVFVQKVNICLLLELAGRQTRKRCFSFLGS